LSKFKWTDPRGCAERATFQMSFPARSRFIRRRDIDRAACVGMDRCSTRAASVGGGKHR
jgi:hypothetical protein